jgi:hypothetical protein
MGQPDMPDHGLIHPGGHDFIHRFSPDALRKKYNVRKQGRQSTPA